MPLFMALLVQVRFHDDTISITTVAQLSWCGRISIRPFTFFYVWDTVK